MSLIWLKYSPKLYFWINNFDIRNKIEISKMSVCKKCVMHAWPVFWNGENYYVNRIKMLIITFYRYNTSRDRDGKLILFQYTQHHTFFFNILRSETKKNFRKFSFKIAISNESTKFFFIFTKLIYSNIRKRIVWL